ncbi:hypothetical protein HAX54_042225 [Datura stramonium]|uniref:Exoribonuclease phosphorolytic domain-containing protein n=1 Tax=Datura stramonium TaxID=4076 RepID=A0ABS8W1D2_DATST|nr:hypothetical protein [Datura stramonium]
MMYSDTGRLNCNVSYSTFATPNRGQGSTTQELLSMHKTFEGAPKPFYDFYCGCFCFVSVSCTWKEPGVLDPISREESYQDGSLMITCMPSRNEVTQLIVTGEWSTPKINEAMELCVGACSKLERL